MLICRFGGPKSVRTLRGARDNEPSPFAVPEERAARLPSLASLLLPVKDFPAIRNSRDPYFARVKIFRFSAICCSAFCMRRVRTEAERRVASLLATAQLALRRRKAGISRTSSSIKLRAEGSGRTDRGLAEPRGAHIPVGPCRSPFGVTGRRAERRSSPIAAAVHYARCDRRCDGCRCAACRRVP